MTRRSRILLGTTVFVALNATLASANPFAFDPPSTYPNSASSWAIGAGDFNRDGVMDVAACGMSNNRLYVFRGLGAGVLAEPLTYVTSGFPMGLAIADLDGDGALDVVTANYDQAHAVAVFRNTGDGTLGTPTSYPAGLSPADVRVGDFNHDGRSDLVVSSMNDDAASVLLQQPNGAFGAPSQYGVGSAPFGIAVGDLNSDGAPDVVTADLNGTVSVLLGNGDGSFAYSASLPGGVEPFRIALADLNDDDHPDIVVSNRSVGTVSVFLGDGTGGFGPRTGFRAGATAWGIAVADLDGDGQLDVVSCDNNNSLVFVLAGNGDGTLAAPVGFPAGAPPNAVTVQDLNGDGYLDLAVSCDFAIAVLLKSPSLGSHQSAVSLATSANPAEAHAPVTITARVEPTSATGTVGFKVDGVLRSVATLAGGVASTEFAFDGVGTHTISATYSGDSTFARSTSAILLQEVVFGLPHIVAVRDVPNDQGGYVFLTWRYFVDEPGDRTVTNYRIWRRVPGPGGTPGTALMASRATGSGVTETFWEPVATVPAAQLVSYGYTARTTQDSLAGANPYACFFVQALTSDPWVWYNSPPDSGYSVDNLAPGTPMPFAGVYSRTANTLHWTLRSTPDLKEFRLYRGSHPDFALGPQTLVAGTRDTAYTDEPGAVYYKLVAVDVHGNVSRVAVVSPDSPVGTLASLVSVAPAADQIALTWFTSANAATLYRRDATSDWASLGPLVTDGFGYVRFVDRDVRPGDRYGYRLGIVDGGEEVAVAEVWATAAAAAFQLMGARPNPVRGGRLSLEFSLPSAAPAQLELFDVNGRRILARDVGALGGGRHQLELGGQVRLPAGLYLARLTQGGRRQVARLAVLD